MHPAYAKKHNILLYKLRIPITPRNVDGTLNQAGKITHFTWIRTKINGRLCLERLLITNIGNQDIIFGLPWFQEHNPSINWKTGEIKMPTTYSGNCKGIHGEEQTKKERNHSPPSQLVNKLPKKEMSPGRRREDDCEQTASSSTLHEKHLATRV